MQEKLEKILIFNFGASYNQFIIQKIRSLGVYAEMIPYDTSADKIQKDKNVIGIILSGSPKAVYEKDGFFMDPEIYNLGIPILGICYGMQLIAHQLGGKVESMGLTEKGKVDIVIKEDNSLLSSNTKIFMDHGDHVIKLPKGFMNHGYTKDTKNAIISNKERKIYGVQFHPEKDESGVLDSFLNNICKAKRNWNLNQYLEEEINFIREKVKNDKVILNFTGDLKSVISAKILYMAVKENLLCINIDHGLYLSEEPDKSIKAFKKYLNLHIKKIDAKERFLNKLKDIYDPEEKRKIIGTEYLNVLREESYKLGNIKFIAQGSFYSDVLESRNFKTGKFVKSHYNTSGLYYEDNLIFLEPVRHLFEDEAKKLGELMSIPKCIIDKDSFPYEGLGIRIIGKVNKKKIDIIKKSDFILKDEISKTELSAEDMEFHIILTDTKSVGAIDLERTYEYVVAIRGVYIGDRMSTKIVRIPYLILEKISSRIINEVNGVNRVVYDITSKPPSTIEWE